FLEVSPSSQKCALTKKNTLKYSESLDFLSKEVIMSPSTKMIEKLKQGIHSLDKGVEAKPDESDDEPLSYFIDHLTPAMIEEARTQLNETDETRPKAMEEFKKLIEKEKKLVSIMDEDFLIAFLRARKFNVKKAFKLLQNYWQFRKEYRYIYDETDAESVMKLILKPILGVLRYRDRKGRVVLVFKDSGIPKSMSSNRCSGQ
ncbi:unnamed protein product, partial [Larinioides sclopetarius]